MESPGKRILILGLLLLVANSAGWIELPFLPPGGGKADMAAYVYERDENPVPDGVEGAIQEINQDPNGKITAVIIEDDQRPTPRWKAARDAAATAGLPCLVLLARGKVIKTIEVETYEDVMKAVK